MNWHFLCSHSVVWLKLESCRNGSPCLSSCVKPFWLLEIFWTEEWKVEKCFIRAFCHFAVFEKGAKHIVVVFFCFFFFEADRGSGLKRPLLFPHRCLPLSINQVRIKVNPPPGMCHSPLMYHPPQRCATPTDMPPPLMCHPPPPRSAWRCWPFGPNL